MLVLYLFLQLIPLISNSGFLVRLGFILEWCLIKIVMVSILFLFLIFNINAFYFTLLPLNNEKKILFYSQLLKTLI